MDEGGCWSPTASPASCATSATCETSVATACKAAAGTGLRTAAPAPLLPQALPGTRRGPAPSPAGDWDVPASPVGEGPAAPCPALRPEAPPPRPPEAQAPAGCLEATAAPGEGYPSFPLAGSRVGPAFRIASNASAREPPRAGAKSPVDLQ